MEIRTFEALQAAIKFEEDGRGQKTNKEHLRRGNGGDFTGWG